MKLNNFLLFFIISFQIKFLFTSEGSGPKVGGSGDVKGLGESSAEVKSLDESESAENQVMWVQTSDAKMPTAIPLEVAELSTLLREGRIREKVTEKKPFLLPKINQIELNLFLEIAKFGYFNAIKIAIEKNNTELMHKFFHEMTDLLIKLLMSKEIALSTIYKLFNLEQYLEIPVLRAFLIKNIAKICAQYPSCLEHLLKNIKDSMIDLGALEEFSLKEQLLNIIPFILEPEVKWKKLDRKQVKHLKQIEEGQFINLNNTLNAVYDWETNTLSIYQLNNNKEIFKYELKEPKLIKVVWLGNNVLQITTKNHWTNEYYRIYINIPDFKQVINNLSINQILLISILDELYDTKTGQLIIKENIKEIKPVIENLNLSKNKKYEILSKYKLLNILEKIFAYLLPAEEKVALINQEEISAEEKVAAIYQLLHKGS